MKAKKPKRSVTREHHEAIAAVRPGLRNMAARIVQGEESFLETLMTLGAISRSEALHVLGVYRKNKVLSERGGEIKVKHGGLLDRVIIRRAAGFEP